ncbi:hypothetical protein MKW92_043482, partial [Papaver armeniacum]
RSKSGRTVEWTTKDLLKGLEEFVTIYETRPIKNNQYGWLKPDLMMESGAFKGHSTWVLRQAINNENYLKKGPAYVDGNCSVMKKHGVTDLSWIEAGTESWVQGVKHLIFEDNYDTGTDDHYCLRYM